MLLGTFFQEHMLPLFRFYIINIWWKKSEVFYRKYFSIINIPRMSLERPLNFKRKICLRHIIKAILMNNNNEISSELLILKSAIVRVDSWEFQNFPNFLKLRG